MHKKGICLEFAAAGEVEGTMNLPVEEISQPRQQMVEVSMGTQLLVQTAEEPVTREKWAGRQTPKLRS